MRLLHALVHVLYPPICMACQAIIDTEDRHTLCEECFETLQLLDLKERCPRCLHPLFTHTRCFGPSASSLKALGACFEDSIVLNALLASQRAPELLAPFLILQHEKLGWLLPDIVLPTPGDRFCRGHQFRVALAQEVATLMHRPCKPLLGLRRLALPFPLLSLDEQPQNLAPRAITIRNPQAIVNAHVLLISDRLTTNLSGRLAAHALLEHGALSVRILFVTGSFE